MEIKSENGTGFMGYDLLRLTQYPADAYWRNCMDTVLGSLLMTWKSMLKEFSAEKGL